MRYFIEQYKYGMNRIEYQPRRGFESLEQAIKKFEELSPNTEFETVLYDERGNTIKRT